MSCAAVAGAVSCAASVSVLHAFDLGGGPAAFALFVLALVGGTAAGIRATQAGKVLPALSRRRLMALAVAVTGLALLLTGLVPDTATVLFLSLLAGTAAGVAANTGHTLLDQETEEFRRARITEHLQAVVRVAVALGAVAAPVLAAAIGPHRLTGAEVVFAHGGAAFTLMLVGALLLPVAVVVLTKADDRRGVPLRRDLREALRGGEPAQAASATGFFIALEGGDGAGKSTQVQALADWIRGKGHEVVVTREPGATPSASGSARSCSTSPRPVCRTAPRHCCTPPTGRNTWTRWCARPWSAARSSSRTATSTPRWPTRAPAVTSPRRRSPGSRAGPPTGSSRT